MRVKRYDGNSMRDVLAQVRMELGSDAVILYTKTYKKGGVLGLLAKERVEVLAGADLRVPEDVPVPHEGHLRVGGGIEEASRRPEPLTAAAELAPAADERLKRIEDNLAALTEAVTRIGPRGEQPTGDELDAPMAEIRGKLIDAEVDPEIARKVIAVSEGAPATDGLDQIIPKTPLEILAAAIPVSGEIEVVKGEQRIVALVGPTGVGKPPTIAKLAARLGLLAKRKVALVTIDTYRIAAVDQLSTYAEIMGVPLLVATDRKSLSEAVKQTADADLILIDTAGRSQKNELQLGELRNCLEGLDAEIHLVLSATTKERDQRDIVEQFAAIPFHRYIISKLDETNSFGFILNLMDRYPSPISYVTTGQRVPDDIEAANQMSLAKRIVGDLTEVAAAVD